MLEIYIFNLTLIFLKCNSYPFNPYEAVYYIIEEQIFSLPLSRPLSDCDEWFPCRNPDH